MQVTIDKHDGTKISFFGVSDFPNTDDGDNEGEDDETADLNFFSTPRDMPSQLNILGTVSHAISEQAFEGVDATEHLAEIASMDDSTVFIAPTDHNQHIVEAAQTLQEDSDFECDDSIFIH